MANPPHPFRVDARLEQLVLHMRPWSDGVVDSDKLGFDPARPRTSPTWRRCTTGAAW